MFWRHILYIYVYQRTVTQFLFSTVLLCRNKLCLSDFQTAIHSFFSVSSFESLCFFKEKCFHLLVRMHKFETLHSWKQLYHVYTDMQIMLFQYPKQFSLIPNHLFKNIYFVWLIVYNSDKISMKINNSIHKSYIAHLNFVLE